jgi:predicted O-methyltransferase YrrM
MANLQSEMKSDERIGRVAIQTAGDIPLSMVRNKTVKDAKSQGFDVILMLDSDNVPDLYVGVDPQAKPFWSTSFDFLYDRKVRGVPTIVCAPYCGPPPHPTRGGEENVYVFYAEGEENQEPGQPEPSMRFAAYSREHAAIMTGIQPIAAGPTGVILYSTCVFDLIPPREDPKAVLEKYKNGQVTLDRAADLLAMEAWFYYEYTDAEQTSKASTEDVTLTRNAQVAGLIKYGEPVVFCNWDSWAGHYKPKCVGKPNPLRIEGVSHVFREAVRTNVSYFDRGVELNLDENEFAYNGPLLELRDENAPPVQDKPDSLFFSVERNGRTFTHVGFASNQKSIKTLQALVKGFKRPGSELSVAEIGSWVGDSACAMDEAVPGAKITCVDTFSGAPGDATFELSRKADIEAGEERAVWRTFLDNTDHFSPRVYRTDSLEAAAALAAQKEQFDLVYIDADHRYEGVKADIEAWLPLVRDGGIICGHDYGDPGFPGVEKAVREAFGDDHADENAVWWHVVNKPKIQEVEVPTAAVVLGKKFASSAYDKEAVSKVNREVPNGYGRYLVVDDQSGEVAWAIAKDHPEAQVYVAGGHIPTPAMDSNSGIITRVNAEAVSTMESQEVDEVYLCSEEALVHHKNFLRHRSYGGRAVVVAPKNLQVMGLEVSEYVGDGWRVLESDLPESVFYLSPKGSDDNPDL